MRLYIPNGSVASERILVHRANEATEKYRSPREDDFSAAERASAAGADGHLSFPTATERGCY